MYTVKEAASIMGLTEHAIRFYTDTGLIPTVKRDKNNNRLFDEESIGWLGWIKCLRECGMPIEALQTYIALCLEGESTLDERYQIIVEQNRIAEEQFEEAKGRLDYLQKKLRHYEDVISHRIPDDTIPDGHAVKAVSRAK